MGEVCEVIAGGDVPKNNFSLTCNDKHQIPIYANGEKNKGLYGYTNIAKVDTPSVTISARGTIGFALVRNKPFFPIVRLIVLKPNENLNVSYLKYAIDNSNIKHTGSSIPQLTAPVVKTIQIPLPPLPEQQAIVAKIEELLSDLENGKQQLLTAQKQLKTYRQSLLKWAFEGKLNPQPPERLNNPQPPERGLQLRNSLKGGLNKIAMNEALGKLGHLSYNQNLTPIAQQNRNNPTTSERKMWVEVLSNEQTGYKFRQQKPIGNFILDFYCSELMLGVEVDGEYHENSREYDDIRTEALEHLGIKIIRFNNHDVLNRIREVQDSIKREIELRQKELTSLEERIEPLNFLKGGLKTLSKAPFQGNGIKLRNIVELKRCIVFKEGRTHDFTKTTFAFNPKNN